MFLSQSRQHAYQTKTEEESKVAIHLISWEYDTPRHIQVCFLNIRTINQIHK